VAAVESEEQTSLRLLVVDDEPSLLKSLHEILKSEGHAVTTASGGQEAIDIVQAANNTQRFDAVITDLGLPHVDGYRVAIAVKLASPATCVILLTGRGWEIVEEGAVPADVDQVLGKPPKLRELRAALARCSRAA
jgi:CheY-like chemotaxis protein